MPTLAARAGGGNMLGRAALHGGGVAGLEGLENALTAALGVQSLRQVVAGFG
jgi:hypothetical protein